MTNKKSNRAWYAVWYAYGDAVSDYDVLARFDSKEERDEFCDRINARYGSGVWEPVTLARVRYRFDVRKFANDPFGDYRHELNGERTCKGKCIEYIYPRRLASL